MCDNREQQMHEQETFQRKAEEIDKMKPKKITSDAQILSPGQQRGDSVGFSSEARLSESPSEDSADELHSQDNEKQGESAENWKNYTEGHCEAILENDPFDKHARFRIAQIWIGKEENMEDAIKLLESIRKQDPNFMVSEILVLYGDK